MEKQGCPQAEKKSTVRDSPYCWCKTTVEKVLLACEYMGDTVNFKTSSKSFKNKRRYENPEENHAIFENTNEPIIDRQTWEMVQQIRAGTKWRQPKNTEKHMLAGLLYCADCGCKLHFNVNHPYTELQYFQLFQIIVATVELATAPITYGPTS